MTTYDYLTDCHPVSRETFQAEVLGLPHVFASEIPTDGGRLMLIRCDDERGPVIGYREDYCGSVQFYIR